MAQIKEDLHDQTGDVFREGPLIGMRLHPAVHLLCHSRNSADYRDILLVDMGFVGSLNRL